MFHSKIRNCIDNRPHLVLQRDPCLLEKFHKIYANNSVTCQIKCKDYQWEDVTMRPLDARDNGDRILLPIYEWSQNNLEDDKISCDVSCPDELGR